MSVALAVAGRAVTRQHVSLALARSGTSISMTVAVAVAARVHAKLFACWAALADMDDLSAWNT